MTTLKGLDANIELTKYAGSLKKQGFDFAIRYYSHTASKNLSLGEAKALAKSGLQIGAVWETAGTKASFFNHTQGVSDGSAAYHMAETSIGQPTDSAIYFAVDYDATHTDIDGPIKDYFTGVNAAFLAAGKVSPKYKIGVYGSGLTSTQLLQAKLVEFTWLTQSLGFSGSRDFAEKKLYNIIQLLPKDITIEQGININIDPDETNPNLPTGLFSL